MLRFLPDALRRLRRLLPSCCALCGWQTHSDHALCTSCWTQFFSGTPLRCRTCAMPLDRAMDDGGATPPLCGECLREPPAFDATIVAVDYAAPADQLVLALKFGGQLALAPLFARLLADAALCWQQRLPASVAGAQWPDLLTAVPLSTQRLMRRGFNQTLEIARPLARLTHITLAPLLLTRDRDTRPQALLTPAERTRNIAGAFSVPPRARDRLAGRHVAVVDDVITTGQTLNEIAATLKRQGAARVTNLVFARTLR